jgi:hypothetical protein
MSFGEGWDKNKGEKRKDGKIKGKRKEKKKACALD